MYVSVYTFFSFLKTFFPFFPPGPHFAEYLHWDVTEECEVRLVCKVRDRFHPEGSDNQGDGQITRVWFYIIYKFKIHCSQLVFIIEIVYEPKETYTI